MERDAGGRKGCERVAGGREAMDSPGPPQAETSRTPTSIRHAKSTPNMHPLDLKAWALARHSPYVKHTALGRPPPVRRWKISAFELAFVVEPNPDAYPLDRVYFARKLAHLQGQRFDPENMAATGTALPALGVPQLIVFRDRSGTVIEVKNAVHSMQGKLGRLEHSFWADALLGIVEITHVKFLAVVAQALCVATFPLDFPIVKPGEAAQSSGSTHPPGSELTVSLMDDVVPHEDPQESSGDAISDLEWRLHPERQIFSIERTVLVPFSLPLDKIDSLVFGDLLNTAEEDGLTSLLATTTGLDFEDLRGMVSEGGEWLQNTLQTVAPPGLLHGTLSDTAAMKQAGSNPKVSVFPKRRKSRSRFVPTDANDPSGGGHSLSVPGSGAAGGSSPRISRSLSPQPQPPLPHASASEGASSRGEGDDKTYRLSLLLGEKVAQLRAGVEKILSSGCYFSYDLDITRSLQQKFLHWSESDHSDGRGGQGLQQFPCWQDVAVGNLSKEDGPLSEELQQLEETRSRQQALVDIVERQFMWNSVIIEPLRRWGIDSRWLVPVMQGSICTTAATAAGQQTVELVLICRRSSRRGGTRYNHRGIDDEGNVANYCESEMLIHAGRIDPLTGMPLHRLPPHYRAKQSVSSGYGWASHVQVRGSVPLYWEQNGMIINPPPQLTRNKEHTIKAFRRHQQDLHNKYGDIFYVNLLSSAKHSEPKLTRALMDMLDYYQSSSRRTVRTESAEQRHTGAIQHIQWDFHARVKQRGFEAALAEFFASEPVQTAFYRTNAFVEHPLWTSGSTVQYQTGVVRTNCLDCLDRTNAFQFYFNWSWLSQYLSERGYKPALMGPSWKVADGLCGVLPPRYPSSYAANPKGTGNHSAPGEQSGSRGKETLFLYFGGQDAGFQIQAYLPSAQTTQKVFDPFYDNVMGDNSFSANPLREIAGIMWAEHGDKISYAYTGTGSVLSALIKEGKTSLSTNVDHIFRSLGRLYQNTFEDNFRQECLWVLLRPPSSATVPEQTKGVMNDIYAQTILAEKQRKATDRTRHHSGRSAAVAGGQRNIPLDLLETSSSLRAKEKRRPDKLTIWVGSLNIGGNIIEKSDAEGLRDWLLDGGPKADVYIVCIQELVELTGMRVLFSSNDQEKQWQIEFLVRSILGHEYLKLRSNSLVGLYLVIFIRDELAEQISNVEIDDVKLGFRGQMGNKGAVLVRCTIGDKCWVFGNLHLIPGVTKFDDRRVQLQTVLNEGFGQRQTSDMGSNACGGNSNAADYFATLGFLNGDPLVDYAVFAGDFNFRTDISCDIDTAEQCIRAGKLDDFFSRDQLSICRRLAIPPFRVFVEAGELSSPHASYSHQQRHHHQHNSHKTGQPPTGAASDGNFRKNSMMKPPFPPTYKYKRRSQMLDRSRTPGWCDRVLVAGRCIHPHAPQRSLMRCLRYASLPNFDCSDHRPVAALLEVDFTPVDVPVVAPVATPTSSTVKARRSSTRAAAASVIAETVLAPAAASGSVDLL